jgi:hypothetical protein
MAVWEGGSDWKESDAAERRRQMQLCRVSLDKVKQGPDHGIWVVGGSQRVFQPGSIVLDGGSEAHLVDLETAREAGWRIAPCHDMSIRTASGDKMAVYGVVKDQSLIINRGTPLQQVVQMDFLVLRGVQGMYKMLLGKQFMATIGGMVDYHSQRLLYRCGYADGAISGEMGAVPLITERQVMVGRSMCVTVAAVEVASQVTPAAPVQRATPVVAKLGSTSLVQLLLWLLLWPVVWPLRKVGEWAEVPRAIYEWHWPGTGAGSRKRKQATSRKERRRCAEHNKRVASSMQLEAVRRRHGTWRQGLTSILLLCCIALALMPGLVMSAPGQPGSAVWGTVSDLDCSRQAVEQANQIYLMQALSSPEGQTFRSSGW